MNSLLLWSINAVIDNLTSDVENSFKTGREMAQEFMQKQEILLLSPTWQHAASQDLKMDPNEIYFLLNSMSPSWHRLLEVLY